TDTKILLDCKAGCSAREICDRLDYDLRDLTFDPDEPMLDLEDIPDDPEAAAHRVSTAVAVADPPAVLAQEPTAQDLSRHAVYQQMLDALELSSDQFDNLRRRGLPPEEIGKRGYKSADQARTRKAVDLLLGQFGRDALLTVPGFGDKDGRVFF